MIVYCDNNKMPHEITALRYCDERGRVKTFSSWYVAALLVWQAVRSCYGSGAWLEDKPWLELEAWKEQ